VSACTDNFCSSALILVSQRPALISSISVAISLVMKVRVVPRPELKIGTENGFHLLQASFEWRKHAFDKIFEQVPGVWVLLKRIVDG
jgi:hypothetical protein